VCDELLQFMGDAVLIAHNAAFDRGFVNAELSRAGRIAPPDARWVCTLQLAQKRYPGMHNSLDALCRRYNVSLAERDKHGALLDAKLLAAVYLELRGGRERSLDFAAMAVGETAPVHVRPVYGARPRPIAPLSTPEERAAHAAFVAGALKGAPAWERFAS
jgi:DNA polymerase-3 subunit epsilon